MAIVRAESIMSYLSGNTMSLISGVTMHDFFICKRRRFYSFMSADAM